MVYSRGLFTLNPELGCLTGIVLISGLESAGAAPGGSDGRGAFRDDVDGLGEGVCGLLPNCVPDNKPPLLLRDDGPLSWFVSSNDEMRGSWGGAAGAAGSGAGADPL